MWKEKLLGQRSNFAYWSPLVLIIFLISLHTTSFAVITNEFSNDDFEIQTTPEFYTDSVIVTRQSEDSFGENNSDYFGGEYSESDSYKQLDGPEEALEDSAETLDGRLGLITMSCFILVLFCFMNRKEKISINKFVSFNSIKGYLMLFIGIISLISVFTITSGLSDYSDEIADSDIDWDVAEGIWGSATVEFESPFDGQSITVYQEWDPSFMMLALFVFSMIALIGGIANTSYLKEDLDIEDAPIWIKDSKIFSLANSHSVTALWIVLVVAIIGSVTTPWQTINQEWEVEHTSESFSGEINVTTHSSEISWNLNPFYIQFDNDTALSNASFEGEETSSYDSYEDHSELSDSSVVMLELRWPLICAIIIGIFMLMQRYVGKFSSAISGTNNGWILLILTSVLLIYSYGAVGSFEDEMSQKIDNDLQDLSPSWDYDVFNSEISSSISGSKLGSAFSSGSTVTPGGGTFDSTSSRILTTWSPAIGYYFAIIIPFAIFAILSVQYGPIVIDSINDYQSIKKFEIEFDSKSWVARPTIIALVTLLITSSIGMGLGELMFDSKSSAPASIYKWDLDFEFSSTNDERFEIPMDDQDIIQSELNNKENGIPSSFVVWLACDESETSLTNQQIDTISWTINPPEETDLFGEMRQGELECSQQAFDWQRVFTWDADINFPKSEFAETEEDYLGQFTVEGGGLGIWTAEFVANVNGGTTEFDSDSELKLSFMIESVGIGNITAENIS
ncbi:MAG: hypothetical protein GWP21_03295 [Euryarchaeota archaeon]|nr:hypothetical protein [Euryarchaeota archaeon]